MDVRAYLEVEAALSRKLRLEWRKQLVPWWAQLSTLLAQKKYDEARKHVELLDLGQIGVKFRAYIKYMLWATAVFGAKIVAKKPMVAVGQYDAFMGKIADNFVLILKYTVTKRVREAALQLIATREGTVQKAGESKPRYVKEFVSFAKEGDENLQLISSLHSSRLAVWGFSAEAEVRGVLRYRLTAVLDSRTSAFCRMINGKEFLVEDARRSINEVLSVQDPDDVKVLQPWPKQTKAQIASYEDLDAKQLTALNLHIPPFHPGCRTLCVLVGSEIIGEAPVQRATVQRVPQTVEDFTGVGMKISPDDLKKWNEVVGQPPLQILSGLTGKPVDQLIGGSSKKWFAFRKDGSIKFQTQGALAGPETKVSVAQVYDPFAGQLYLTRTAFDKASWKQSANFIKTLYKGSLDNATALGASGVTLTTNGKFGAYSHSQFGFLPSSAVEWSNLRNELLMDLADGGRLAHVWAALSKEQAGVLKLILGSTDLKGFWALADLTATVQDVALGRLLLTDRKVSLTLPVGDKVAVERFEEYFA